MLTSAWQDPTAFVHIHACVCAYVCTQSRSHVKLIPIPTFSLWLLAVCNTKGQGLKIWSHVVLSGRQRVDTREVWTELTVRSAPPQNTTYKHHCVIEDLQIPQCSKTLLLPLPDFITVAASGAAGCCWMLDKSLSYYWTVDFTIS